MIIRCSSEEPAKASRTAAYAGCTLISRAPSARTIARLLTIGRDQLSKAQTIKVAAIERGVAALAEARDILAEFKGIIRRKALPELDAWLSRAARSLIAAVANGIVKDKAAVQAAIVSAWSKRSNRRSNLKLKLVKRQMYGRGKIDLLQARVIGMN
jgi:transposase